MRSILPARGMSVALGVLLLAACGDVAGSGDAESRTYVTTLGSDTLTVERFTRTEMTIEGELVERNPTTHRLRYTARLASPNGFIASLEADYQVPEEDGSWSSTRWTTEMGDGVATVTLLDGEDAGTTEVEIGEGAIPSLGRTATAMFVMEQAFREASAMDHAHHPVQFVSTAPQAATNTVSRMAGDTVSMSFFGNPMKFWADNGELVGVSGDLTTFKQEVRRATSDLDLDALAGDWANRDARGEGLGTPSPAATVDARLDGASVQVRYSRPAMRGREIWGGLVPNGEVWRTGANAATHFTSSADLMIGGLRVPAGTYTLWSLYEDGDYTLIVNEQTNQWGTQYDPVRDLGRVPLSGTELDAPQERFEITISEGMLHLIWDTARWSVPIAVR